METTTLTRNHTEKTTNPTSIITQKMNLRICVFHASHYPDIAAKYHKSQLQVLKEFGVDAVSSIKSEWWNNPCTYMFIVEDIVTGEIGAGMRLEVVDNKHSIPLEEALEKLSPDIAERVHKYNHILGEVCGLWVKKSFSGRNLPSHLLRSILCVAPKLRVEYLIALLPTHTMSIFSNSGFEVVENIGNKGQFFYPDERYISTVMELKNVSDLNTLVKEKRLKEEEAEMIAWLKSNPEQALPTLEICKRNRQTKIKYDLRIM